jgi:hypothetical protein
MTPPVNLMGLFDAPAPLFAWLDVHMGEWVPPVFRLVIWGAVFGAISMLLYRGLSAQDRIERDKRELKAARKALNAFDGEMEEAWPLMRRVVRLSLRQVGRVGWPAIVASLPLVFVLCWADGSFRHAYPGWEWPFFGSLLVVSIGLKVALRIV